jgi:outer membrane protein assembly factor BamA
MRSLVLTLALGWVISASLAAAQPESAAQSGDTTDEQEDEGEEVSPDKFDPASCAKLAVAPTPTTTVPATWTTFEIRGELVDKEPVVRALYEPTMSRYRALTEDAREEVRRISAAYGYHLVGLGTRDTGEGTLAVVNLAPLPHIRKINVNVKQSLWDTLFEDEIRRRMRVRVGSYLPWTPRDRRCQLFEETERIEEYLRDEGYFDARARMFQKVYGHAVMLTIRVELGKEYKDGVINFAPREPNGITNDQIRSLFRHQRCIIPKLSWTCFGAARFTRSQHQADIKSVIDLFHNRGFPSARVQTALDHDRRTQRVNIMVTIDQRRQLDVVFEGHDPDAISIESLRNQLTFNAAGNSDDVEANESAKALTAYLQRRGYFDARVTWSRERFERFDRLIYRIAGEIRRLAKNGITYKIINAKGKPSIDSSRLDEAIDKSARVARSFLTTTTAPTSEQFDIDVALLLDVYRREGYRDAKITASAATVPAALGDPALTAAMLVADRGDELHVQYTIEEGLPTLIRRISVELGPDGDKIATPEQRELCEQVRRDLGSLFDEVALTMQVTPDRCTAEASKLVFKEYEVVENRDKLRDRLFSRGRARSQVLYESKALGPHEVEIHYQLRDYQPLTIGKVVVRGNFRTSSDVILRELKELEFKEGAPLSNDTLAEAARGLRTMGLFDAVNIEMPDLDNASSGAVNAVVELTERYDFLAAFDTEGGYSSYNGTFVRLAPTLPNLFGAGVSLGLGFTIGFNAGEFVDTGELTLRQLAAEATLKIPPWLSRRVFSPLEFQTEISASHRRQDTPRFGLLTTNSATLAFSHTWSRPRLSADKPARAITFSPRYEFRLRDRSVDAMRPLGADEDQPQVPISTRTGSVGASIEWEQRLDRRGNLSPLDPEAGFRLEAQASWANKYFLGQHHFVKVGAGGAYYVPIFEAVVVRTELRYDQGFPIGRGVVLLPEVERFFAGGDSTVRGYEDDRLATEIIEVDVPPLDNATQLRVLPAGGNIRVIGSVDAQVKIFNWGGLTFASGVFVDAGMISNQWSTVDKDSIRPAVGVGLARLVTGFGTLAVERAIPLRPQFGDDPSGRWHFSFAARAQF